jgi:hypothetical protein
MTDSSVQTKLGSFYKHSPLCLKSSITSESSIDEYTYCLFYRFQIKSLKRCFYIFSLPLLTPLNFPFIFVSNFSRIAFYFTNPDYTSIRMNSPTQLFRISNV